MELALISLIHFNQKLRLEEEGKNDVIIKTLGLEKLYFKKRIVR